MSIATHRTPGGIERVTAMVGWLIVAACLLVTFPLVDATVVLTVWPMIVEDLWDGRSVWLPAVMLGTFVVAFVAILALIAVERAERGRDGSGWRLLDHPVIVYVYYPVMMAVSIALLIRSLVK